MIDFNTFTEKLADVFDMTDASSLTPETKLKEINGWSSFIALGIMAMVKSEYDIALTAQQMREVGTIQDLFKILQEKLQ